MICPVCSKSFDDSRGMNVHKSRWKCGDDTHLTKTSSIPSIGSVPFEREILFTESLFGDALYDMQVEVETEISSTATGTKTTSHITKYVNFQKDFVARIYGENAFIAKSTHEFIDAVANNPLNLESHRQGCLMLNSFAKEAQLSRAMSNKLLKLIMFFKPAMKIPKGWRSVKKHIDKHIDNDRDFIESTLSYPDDWKMSDWKETGQAPLPVSLRTRDPLMCIAELFVNPHIMINWRQHVQLDAYKKYVPGMHIIHIIVIIFNNYVVVYPK